MGHPGDDNNPHQLGENCDGQMEQAVHWLVEGRQLDETDGYCGILGRSREMQRVLGIIEKAAQSDAPVIEALRQTGGNQTRAARLLGINRVTVWNRMRRYGINLKRELKSSTILD